MKELVFLDSSNEQVVGRPGANAAPSPNALELQALSDPSRSNRLEHSKTQQAGVTATSTPHKPVLDRAALALRGWLEVFGIIEGGHLPAAMETAGRPCPVPGRRR